jgi:hypothetical protein
MDRSSCTCIQLHVGSVKSIQHLVVIVSRLLIRGVVLRRKIEREFISLSSQQKGNAEQAWDYG